MGDPLTIEQYIQQKSELVVQGFDLLFPADWFVPTLLQESMRYSLLAGGKRMRPILVLAACEAVAGQAMDEAALPVCAAIEMIHTYSLIHDDLPAMDNDDYRRGKLTNHKVYGEAMAILAGDALLTHAFHSITQITRQHGISAEQVLAIVEDLSRYAGACGMVGGQAADMQGEQGITSLQELEYIHIHKTSDLIIFSLKAGGRLAGATDSELAALEGFGHNLGLAFQIQDDILDVTGDAAKLGKPVNSDEQQAKVTYPFFIGLEESRRKVQELTEAARSSLTEAGLKAPERLLQIAHYLMNRDH